MTPSAAPSSSVKTTGIAATQVILGLEQKCSNVQMFKGVERGLMYGRDYCTLRAVESKTLSGLYAPVRKEGKDKLH
jgi:hypothetical protein